MLKGENVGVSSEGPSRELSASQGVVEVPVASVSGFPGYLLGDERIMGCRSLRNG